MIFPETIMSLEFSRSIVIPEGSTLSESDYFDFLDRAYRLMKAAGIYFAPEEGPDTVELAHIIPQVPETVIALYVGINDAVCNKGLVTSFLVRHGHSNVFAFDPQVYSGGEDVPSGTVDTRTVLSEFEPPNASWNPSWTYVVIEDPWRTPESIWREKGYIDMIAAKFEDFTLLSDERVASVCFFIDERAFDHPVNRGRIYLDDARRRGERSASEYGIPGLLRGETEGLVPVILHRGEKLYVATPDHSPCAHAWSALHPANRELPLVNENSAVPLDLIVAKPPANPAFARHLIPAHGSADMTTDMFFRGSMVCRRPLLEGGVKG